MKVSIELKHLIIVGIVVIYTFTSIVLDLTNQLYNPTLNVAFIYNSADLSEGSDSEQIWNALNDVKENAFSNVDNSKYDSMELENVNIQAKLTEHINEYALKNEVVVVNGSSYNEKIGNVIRENPSTQFILIDSEYEANFPNLAKIDVENEAKVKESAKDVAKMTKTNKVLYLGTELEYNLTYDTFADEVIKNNSKATISSIIVDDKVDKVEIKKKLMESFSEGYDSVYVANRNLNKITIETAKSVQDEIISDRAVVDEQLKAIEENKNNATTNEVLTDENGEAVTDENGENVTNEIEVVTDDSGDIVSNENSELVTDENGDIVSNENSELVTDENGNEVTTDESSDVVTDKSGEVVTDEKGNEVTTTDEGVEVPTYKYEQEQIHLFVNSDDSLDAGIYYSDETNASVTNVVDGYIDTNYEEILNKDFKQIIKGNQISTTDNLTFDNEGLELIKE